MERRHWFVVENIDIYRVAEASYCRELISRSMVSTVMIGGVVDVWPSVAYNDDANVSNDMGRFTASKAERGG